MSRFMRVLAMALAVMVGLTVTGTGAAVADPGDPTIAYGLVTESNTDAPLTNLSVEVFTSYPAEGVTKLTDATIVQGDEYRNYEVSLAPGEYWLVMKADGHKKLIVQEIVPDANGGQVNLGGQRLDVDTGVLDGIVTNPAGTGYNCAQVQFYDATGDGSDYVDYTDSNNLATSGAYRRELPVGTYKVFVGDDCENYVSQWVGGTSFATATTYTVTADKVTPVQPVRLDDGAVLSGLVQKAGSTSGLDNITVVLSTKGANPRPVADDTTSTSGAYSLNGVVPGEYELTFSDRLGEYQSTSRDVTVGTADQAVEPVKLDPLPSTVDTNLLTGKVTGPDKAGIGSINVGYIGSYIDEGGDEVYTSGNTRTKRDGTWSASVPQGDYRIQFAGYDQSTSLGLGESLSTYQSEWFDNAPTYGRAKIVTVGTAKLVINAELVKSAVISGKVTLPFTDVEESDLSVEAYDDDGERVRRTAVDQETGTYSLEGLAPGTYRIKASGDAYSDENGGGPLIRQFYAGKYSLATGTTIVAGNGKVVTGRNIALSNKLSAIAAPKVSGTAKKGKKLVASVGSWTLGVDTTYTYQWYRGTAKIAGKTASTYTVSSADVGKTLKVKVTASNRYDDYLPGTADSAATKKVVK